MKETNPATEPIGQNLIKLISNLCFSVFVFLVLIFTVIAITYQPPDPWLESAPALTKFFTQSENATFKNDNSILKTGEDLQSVSAPAVPPALVIEPITEQVIEKSEKVANMTLQSSGCEDLQVVNCSDPRVLITVEKFNLKWFKSIVFLEYQTLLMGQSQMSVMWPGGGWHSGINSRRQRNRVNATKSGGNILKITSTFRDEEINDTIPSLGSEMNFRKGREAMYLNRTFVMDLSICLAGSYNPSGKDEEGKDFRYYFDFEHLKELASIVEESEFLRDWKKWDRAHKKKVPVRKVVTHKVTPMQLSKDRSTIIWRQFDAPEPENYCSCGSREKAQNKELWPHLDADTSPDALVVKLQGMIQPRRNLYIATNEPFYNYFDKLRSHFKVHLLDDYKALWGNTSDWYNETMLLNNGWPVEFDGYMRVAVDTEVLYRAKTRVETFYNLTSDCKDGINTC
ncbi:hypothetical protein GH714_012343 [Hevea brasiliensis]|uniref:O-fucosyltransferase family protein n=1 Tax=Hevea brasiliensis TaxID=3981 RepID=A0A6A6KBF2_HEVBR|nr:hypothetical protein GH714_012343 [Hevea brasiliensis]